MVNRYSGEIRINPVAILRNDDFNNEGEIKDIGRTLQQAIDINNEISGRLSRLKDYLEGRGFSDSGQFNFSPGGYIAMRGFPDKVLLEMKSKKLIELFDFATDRDWVKKYGAQFGLVWEDGRAVKL